MRMRLRVGGASASRARYSLLDVLSGLLLDGLVLRAQYRRLNDSLSGSQQGRRRFGGGKQAHLLIVDKVVIVELGVRHCGKVICDARRSKNEQGGRHIAAQGMRCDGALGIRRSRCDSTTK